MQVMTLKEKDTYPSTCTMCGKPIRVEHQGDKGVCKDCERDLNDYDYDAYEDLWTIEQLERNNKHY